MILETTIWTSKALADAYTSGLLALSDMVLDMGGVSITWSEPKLNGDGNYEVITYQDNDEELDEDKDEDDQANGVAYDRMDDSIDDEDERPYDVMSPWTTR